MSSTTTTRTAASNTAGNTTGTLKLRGQELELNDSFPELKTRGWTVVKNAIPQAKASEYEDRAYKWLESYGKGYKQDDRSTWKVDNLPAFNKGGLFNRNACHHEQWVWDIRSEQGVIDQFAKIWGTDELLVSFDGVNVSLPFDKEEMGDRATPWPHVDQSPNRRHLHCVQGIVNLAENGPNDGGLTVLEGSLPLYNEFFDTHADQKPAEGWSWKDSHSFTEKDLEWFYARGCKWHKIEAGPGDVILWDSRSIHYGAAAQGDRPRVATYVCYKPAKDITPEKLAEKTNAVKEYIGSSHDPVNFHLTGTKIYGPLTPDERLEPIQPAVLSEKAQKLAGVLAY
ncbi:hypothetical protein IAT40_003890 [Kwoniella sp. CBS 6097]